LDNILPLFYTLFGQSSIIVLSIKILNILEILANSYYLTKYLLKTLFPTSESPKYKKIKNKK